MGWRALNTERFEDMKHGLNSGQLISHRAHRVHKESQISPAGA